MVWFGSDYGPSREVANKVDINGLVWIYRFGLALTMVLLKRSY